MAATTAAVVLVFGEHQMGAPHHGGAEGGQTSLFLAAAPFQTPSVACEGVKLHSLSSDPGMLDWG